MLQTKIFSIYLQLIIVPKEDIDDSNSILKKRNETITPPHL